MFHTPAHKSALSCPPIPPAGQIVNPIPPTFGALHLAADPDAPDALLSNHGTIALVTPLTPAARDWLAGNVDPGAQWFGRSLAVEPRYLAALADGMTGAGLVLV